VLLASSVTVLVKANLRVKGRTAWSVSWWAYVSVGRLWEMA
jgi:hypothetical protein